MVSLPQNFNQEKFLADFLVSKAIHKLSAEDKLSLLQKIDEGDADIILRLVPILEDEKKDLGALEHFIAKVVDEATFEAFRVAKLAKIKNDEASSKEADEMTLENLLS